MSIRFNIVDPKSPSGKRIRIDAPRNFNTDERRDFVKALRKASPKFDRIMSE